MRRSGVRAPSDPPKIKTAVRLSLFLDSAYLAPREFRILGRNKFALWEISCAVHIRYSRRTRGETGLPIVFILASARQDCSTFLHCRRVKNALQRALGHDIMLTKHSLYVGLIGAVAPVANYIKNSSNSRYNDETNISHISYAIVPLDELLLWSVAFYCKER